jgi:hypothetical protein
MGVVGAAIKGFGKAFLKGKKAKLKTVYRVKPGVDISRFKKSKKHGLKEKLDIWANRESGKLLSQAGSGINIKYTKEGKPFVPKGTKPSMLTRAKGWSKIASPVIAGATAGTIHGKIKDKKK